MPRKEASPIAVTTTDDDDAKAAAPLTTFSTVDKGTPVFLQIAKELIRAIQRGDLPVGERLPTELALSENFQVSRASVREALSSLQFAGYIESRRGFGTVVRSTVPEGMGALETTGLETPTDIIDLFEARLALEPETIRQAATNPLPEALNLLQQLLEGMHLVVDHPEIPAHTDLRVHLALVRACPNPFMAWTSEQLLVRTEGQLWRDVRDQAWEKRRLPQEWLTHHHQILTAVTERDPNRASTGMTHHLLSVLQNAAVSAPLSKQDRQRVNALKARYGATSP